MWSGGAETGEEGEHVLLYQPIKQQQQQHQRKHSLLPANTSRIGGNASFFSSSKDQRHPFCCYCKDSMCLLIQIYAPIVTDDGRNLDRSLHLFACAKKTCHVRAFRQQEAEEMGGKSFVIGGGVVRCLRSQTVLCDSDKAGGPVADNGIDDDIKPEKAKEVTKISENGDDWGPSAEWNTAIDWTEPSKEASREEEWGGTGDGDDMPVANSTLDNLEAMLRQCQTNTVPKKTTTKKKRTKSTKKKSSPLKQQKEDKSTFAFPCIPLEYLDEPMQHRNQKQSSQLSDVDSDDDENDNAINDAAVQQMIAKYLEQEEDADIVSAIASRSPASSSLDGSGSSVSSGEAYERLPPSERAFLFFSNRIRLCPRQVARYAYGGIPMWSVPVSVDSFNQSPSRAKQQRDRNSNRDLHLSSKKRQDNPSLIPPLCICGAKRHFEFQVLPSILYVLGVDQVFTSSPSSLEEMLQREFVRDDENNYSGGIDFANIAVYSCANSCDLSLEEFVVVQTAVDGDIVPRKRTFEKIPASDRT